MFLETLKSEGLAHNSYVIGEGDGAAVVDPSRDAEGTSIQPAKKATQSS